MIKFRSTLVAIGILLWLMSNTVLGATDYFWVANGGSANWSLAANWRDGAGNTPLTAPGLGASVTDNVYFNSAGTANAIIDNNINLRMITLGQTASPYAGTIFFTAGANYTLRAGNNANAGGIYFGSGTNLLDATDGNLLVATLSLSTGTSAATRFIAPQAGMTCVFRTMSIIGTYTGFNANGGTITFGKLGATDIAVTATNLKGPSAAQPFNFNHVIIEISPSGVVQANHANIYGTLTLKSLAYFFQPSTTLYNLKVWGNLTTSAADNELDITTVNNWLGTITLSGSTTLNNLQLVNTSDGGIGTIPANIVINKPFDTAKYVSFGPSDSRHVLFGGLDVQAGKVVFGSQNTLIFHSVTNSSHILRFPDPINTVLTGLELNAKSTGVVIPLVLKNDLYLSGDFTIRNIGSIDGLNASNVPYTIHSSNNRQYGRITLLDNDVGSNGSGSPVIFQVEGSGPQAEFVGNGMLPCLSIDKTDGIVGADSTSIVIAKDLIIRRLNRFEGGGFRLKGNLKTSWVLPAPYFGINHFLISMEGVGGNQTISVDGAGATGALPSVQINRGTGGVVVSDNIAKQLYLYGNWMHIAGTVDYSKANLVMRDTEAFRQLDLGSTTLFSPLGHKVNSILIDNKNPAGNAVAFLTHGFPANQVTIKKGCHAMFAQGQTFTFDNIDWVGDSNDPVYLASTSPGINWNLILTTGGTKSFSYLDMRDTLVSPFVNTAGLNCRSSYANNGGWLNLNP